MLSVFLSMDYFNLNNQLLNTKYPFPRIKDVFDHVQVETYLAKIAHTLIDDKMTFQTYFCHFIISSIAFTYATHKVNTM